MTLGIGFTVEDMAVHRTDDRIAILGAEALNMLRRLGNSTHHLTNRRATIQPIDPHGAAVVGGPLEHVSINLIHDAAPVGRARRLSHGQRWGESERADENSYTQHDNLLSVPPCRRAFTNSAAHYPRLKCKPGASGLLLGSKMCG